MAYLARGYIFILSDTDRHEEAINMLYEAERLGSLEASVALGQRPNAGIRTFIRENTFGGLGRLLKSGRKEDIFFQSQKTKREKMIHWLCRSGRRGQYMLADKEDVN